MAKVKVKGAALQQELAMTFTTVAQLTSLNLSGAESETVESDTLDNTSAGIPYESTGRSEGGSVDFEGIHDVALAGHQAITDLITTPADQNWKIVNADSGSTEEAFTGAGVSHDRTYEQGDLVRFSGSIKVDGLITYAT